MLAMQQVEFHITDSESEVEYIQHGFWKWGRINSNKRSPSCFLDSGVWSSGSFLLFCMTRFYFDTFQLCVFVAFFSFALSELSFSDPLGISSHIIAVIGFTLKTTTNTQVSFFINKINKIRDINI